MRSCRYLSLIWGMACSPPALPVPPDPDFVELPPGAFEMGCDNGGDFLGCYLNSDEGPVSQVRLTRGFYLQKSEVTQKQFQDLVGESPFFFADCGPDCPAESVTWHDVALYANRKSEAAELPACYLCAAGGDAVECKALGNPYDCEGYRLPTEAEWEYAARLGPDVVAWGARASYNVAWFSENSDGTPHSVMGKEPNFYGLYDMSGNVQELVHDWYEEDYPSVAEGENERVDPTGVDIAYAKSSRGGDWRSTWSDIRTTSRSGHSPDERFDVVGFRLARTVPEE